MTFFNVAAAVIGGGRHCLSPSFMVADGGAAAAARVESSWCQMAFTRVSVVAAADNFGVTVQPALYSGGLPDGVCF